MHRGLFAGLYKTPSKFTGRYIAKSRAKGGLPPGKKLQLHPTKLTWSTRVMWWKGLGWVACVG